MAYDPPITDYTKITCTTCALVFCVTNDFAKSRKYTKVVFYCPNSHHLQYGTNPLQDAPHTAPIEAYVRLTCGNCSIQYLVTTAFESNQKRTHKTFKCPNGHNQQFPPEVKPPPPPPPPLTPEQVDYTKMIAYHEALSRIALFKPGFLNKKSLRLAINIARNAIELSKLKE